MTEAQAITLASYRAGQIIKRQIRNAGGKAQRMSVVELRHMARDYVHQHPDLVAWAGTEILSLAPKPKARG